MIMHVNIKRLDQAYKDIEEFKDYERIQCVVYEAAIRNNVFKEKLLDAVSNINKDYLSYLNGTYHDKKDTFDYEKLKHLRDYFSPEDKDKEIILDKSTKDKIMLNFFITDIMYDLRIISINSYEKQDLLKINEIRHFKIIQDFEKIFDKKATKEGDDIVNIEDGNGYLIKQNGAKEYLQADHFFNTTNEIIQDFSRPVLIFRDGMHAQVHLDFSLSEDDLHLYIKQLYKDIRTEKTTSIASPASLLGEDLSFTEDFFLPLKKMDLKKTADHFFIYDYFKKAMSINENLTKDEIFQSIDSILSDYHNREEKKDFSGYDKNLKKMIDLIDNKKYIDFSTKIKDHHQF